MVHWNPEIKVGDLLTGISVLVAVSAFFYAWIKDSLLRKREYADQIRRSAAETIVALERWRQIALQFYENIQPLITETDAMVVKLQNEASCLFDTRDFLWRGLTSARADLSKLALSEKTESAYLGLYGYEPRVQALYDSVIGYLNSTDRQSFSQLLQETQRDVLKLKEISRPIKSAQLGNSLRFTTADLADELKQQTGVAVGRFRLEMMRLIAATDDEIVHKSIRVTESPDDFPRGALPTHNEGPEGSEGGNHLNGKEEGRSEEE
jgi:hypothetical protein